MCIEKAYKTIEIGQKSKDIEFPNDLVQPDILNKYSLLFVNKLVNITNFKHEPNADLVNFIKLDNLLKQKLIIELFQDCKEEKIEIVLLKGNALNFLLNGIKQTADIDILIISGQSKIEAILNKNYKRIFRKNSKYTEKQQITWQHRRYKDQYLDFHHQLGNPIFYEVPSSLIKENIVNFTHKNTTIYCLSPELSVANYIMQIIMDANVKHYGLIDINLIISFSELNFEKFLSILKILDLIKIAKYLNIIQNNRIASVGNCNKEKSAFFSIISRIFSKQPNKYELTNKIRKILLYLISSERPFRKIYELISKTLK